MLIIDSREHHIINILSSLLTKDNINFKIDTLDCGDFHITTDTAPGRGYDDVVCLIERKTISDLVSSIKSGRFREQKQRIEKYNENVIKIYIIEEYNTLKSTHVMYKSIIGAITNLIVKHGIFVLPSNSINETIHYINDLHKKMIDQSNVCQSTTDLKVYNPLVSVKKSDVRKDNLFVIQLMCIHGVSQDCAETINEMWDTSSKLIDAFKEKGPNLLATLSRKSGRKIGKKLVCRH
jgi:ERCC4-type nuclease